jgi:hypothetical protein
VRAGRGVGPTAAPGQIVVQDEHGWVVDGFGAGGPPEDGDDGYASDASDASFGQRVRNVVLAVIGQNPANLQALPASWLGAGSEDFDPDALAFPSEPFGPCAITTGPASHGLQSHSCTALYISLVGL